jgi:putative phage-type endonuclease
MEQRTQEWLSARCGRFTGSEISKIMGDRGLGEKGVTYIIKKVAEEMTGNVETIRENDAMRWGTMHEQEAREYYERVEKVTVDEAGFIELNPHAGMSPDGIIPAIKKGIEIKCPFTAAEHVNHILCFSAEELKKSKTEYYWQCLMGLLVFGFDSWDFISYNPKFKAADKMSILTIKRADVAADIEFLHTRIAEAITVKKRILAKIYDLPFEEPQQPEKEEKQKKERKKKDEKPSEELEKEENREPEKQTVSEPLPEDVPGTNIAAVDESPKNDVEIEQNNDGQQIKEKSWRERTVEKILVFIESCGLIDLVTKKKIDPWQSLKNYAWNEFKLHSKGVENWANVTVEMLTDEQLSRINAFFYKQAQDAARVVSNQANMKNIGKLD